MRTILLVAIAASMSACAPPYKDPRTIHGVDAEFRPYIDAYISYKGRPLSYDIPVRFGNISSSLAGLCTRWSSGERQIQINAYHWQYMNEGARLELILHELGHCDLNREHVTTISGYMPTSIMYPYVFSLNSLDLPYYLNELFSVNQPRLALKQNTSCVLDIKVE